MAKPAAVKPSRPHWLRNLILGVLGLGLAVFLFAFFKFGPGSHLVSDLSAPACGDGPLTVAPTADSDFDRLIPLGNLNPPDHTIPTDHIYYVFKRNSANDPVPVVAIHAPGKIHLNQVMRATAIKDGQVFTDDYKLSFSVCRGVQMYFDHITGLSDKLKAVASGLSCKDTHPRPSDTYRYCQRDVDVALEPGEIIGQAGGKAAAGFDFGASNTNAPKLAYANPKRYGDLHTACPIDLFTQPVKGQLMARFDRPSEPKCGEVNQDKAGTLQGNWFSFEGDANSPDAWSKSLSLVHENVDPAIGAVSIGGLNGFVGKLDFKPTTSGNLNREFSGVVPGDQVYCYQTNAQLNSGGPGSAGDHVLIQLTSAAQLKIEHQPGSCGNQATYSFTDPTVYSR